MNSKNNFKRTAIFCFFAVWLTGCSGLKPVEQSDSHSNVVRPDVDSSGIEAAQRALPTINGNSTQRAHYDHVYIDPRDAKARSLKTITLDDAIANDVLASSNLPVVRQEIDTEKLRWVVFSKADRRPSDIEGVGGFGIEKGNYTEVNFNVNETEILNKEKILPLVSKAGRVSGVFYLVGYADETGIEAKNKTLSEKRANSVKEFLVAANIHRTRIIESGGGISRIYPDLASNRRTSIIFKLDSKK